MAKKKTVAPQPKPDFYAFELKALDKDSTFTVHLSAQVLTKEGHEFDTEEIALGKVAELIKQRIDGKIAEDIFYRSKSIKLPKV